MNKIEEYEVIVLTILSSSLLFCHFTPNYIIIIFSVILTTFLVILKGKKYIYLFLFFLPPFLNPLFNYTEEIKYNKTYIFQIEVSDKKIKIEKVTYRSLNGKYYLKLDENLYENGRYIVEYKVKEIKKYHNSKEIIGDLLSIKRNYFDNLAFGIRKKVEELSFDIDLETFTMGVVLGDKSRISRGLDELFKNTSTSHLLAISGLHLGIVLGFLLGTFSFFSLKFQIKYILTFILVSIYVFIIGFSPSVQRAYIMTIIFLLSKIFFDKSNSKKSLCIAFVITLVINMSLIKNIAFQMSYMALYGILYLYKKGENQVVNIVKMSFLVQLSLSPIFVNYFNILPLGAFITNIFAVFWGSVLILFIYLNIFFQVFYLGFLLKPFSQFLFDVLIVFLGVVGKIPYMTVELMRNIPNFLYLPVILSILLYPFIKNKKFYFIFIILFPIYFILEYRIIEKDDFIYFPKEKVYVVKNKISYILKGNKYKSKYILTRKGEVEGTIGLEDGEMIDFGTLEISRRGRNFVYRKK